PPQRPFSISGEAVLRHGLIAACHASFVTHFACRTKPWCNITGDMPIGVLNASAVGAKLATEHSCPGAVAAEALALRDWLFDCALPLWWRVGADHDRGGFYEAIALDGTPVAGPQRARTIARQAYSYCEAGRLGWAGPWRTAAQHALAHL